MGLWKFVTANGITQQDATDEIRTFLAQVGVADLQHPDTWRQLRVLVQVRPDADIFPVRARYDKEQMATIGLNYLSADRPLWFTFADCVASKLLTGRAPKMIQAIRFEPKAVQNGLRPITIAGNEEYRINPAIDDFYKRVIDLRRSVKRQLNKQKEKNADEREIKRLDSEQMALKILANATSYGVFIELNVEETDEQNDVLRFHTATGSRKAHAAKREEPGEFFHPLLGTLITGAARLMLAITERLLIDEGLDWAFCDTDSMAFAAPEGMALGEFEKRVRRICAWFEPLNPYEQRGSILEFEDQNFARDASGRMQLEPLYCSAISAKRYALFNLDSSGDCNRSIAPERESATSRRSKASPRCKRSIASKRESATSRRSKICKRSIAPKRESATSRRSKAFPRCNRSIAPERESATSRRSKISPRCKRSIAAGRRSATSRRSRISPRCKRSIAPKRQSATSRRSRIFLICRG